MAPKTKKRKRRQTLTRRRTGQRVRNPTRDRVFDILLVLVLIGIVYIIYETVSTYRREKIGPGGTTVTGKVDDIDKDSGEVSTLAWLMDAVITVSVLIVLGILFRWWFFSERSAIRHTRWNRRLKPSAAEFEKLEDTLVQSIKGNWKERSLREKFDIILQYDISALKLNWKLFVAYIKNLFESTGALEKQKDEIEKELKSVYNNIDQSLDPRGMDVEERGYRIKEKTWWEYILSHFR